jgi:hypothetical protein
MLKSNEFSPRDRYAGATVFGFAKKKSGKTHSLIEVPGGFEPPCTVLQTAA